MIRANSSLVVLALLFTAACGGSEPAPKAPEPEPAPVADMPAPAVAEVAKPVEAPMPEPVAAPAVLALPAATAKIDMKGKKAAKVELKSDGTVTNGGKAVAKVSGMALQSPDGAKSLLSVGSDGAVTTGDGGSYGSFSGDELTMTKGDKLTLGDDGMLTMTSAGKTAPLGKFDGASTAKRSAVLAAAFVLAPPAAAKPAGVAKPMAAPSKPAAAPSKK